MLNIDLNRNDITSPGLYIMRWQGRTGLVRIVGEPSRGWTIIQPQNAKETLMTGLPVGGGVPKDAAFSEALNIVGP